MLSVDSNRRMILDALQYIWNNPETGYKEWKTSAYLADKFESLGYTLTMAGDIPGFTAVLDTGRPGPTVAIFGELDGLIVPEHPEADPETGAVHACGHCAQAAALLGVAAAMKEVGATDGLSGKILFVAVPAEELIEFDFRLDLRSKGTIQYLGGKPEFLRRGLLDGVDLAFMVHTATDAPGVVSHMKGANGMMAKTVVFEGKSAHAGSAPFNGVNALYAANIALSAINAIRETFRDEDYIRVHPIITEGGASVNAVPDKVCMESYIRGASMEAIADVNYKVNRACAAAAAAMGANAVIQDFPGYWPRRYDEMLVCLFGQAAQAEGLKFTYKNDTWGSGCSDIGDIGSIIPTAHPTIGGATGTGHGSNYFITDPDAACVDSAKLQVAALRLLLENGGEKAWQIVKNFKPEFDSKEEYFAYVNKLEMHKRTVSYEPDGSVRLSLT